MERTEAYSRFQRDSCINEEEFQKRIREEARIRKIRAKALISRHKIGSAIAGIFPLGDYIANKYFIKKDAARKAGQIFGFDLKELEESLKKEKDKKEKLNLSNQTTIGESYEGPTLKIIEQKDKINNNKEKGTNNNVEKKADEKGEEDEKKSKKKENDQKIKVSGYTTMYAMSIAGFAPRVIFTATSVGLIAVSAVFSIVASAIGVGVGYYLMKRHCEDLLDQFEQLFIQNADKVSNSLIFGINYLKNMAEYYKKQGC